jgi:hypothetical protein
MDDLFRPTYASLVISPHERTGRSVASRMVHTVTPPRPRSWELA